LAFFHPSPSPLSLLVSQIYSESLLQDWQVLDEEPVPRQLKKTTSGQFSIPTPAVPVVKIGGKVRKKWMMMMMMDDGLS